MEHLGFIEFCHPGYAPPHDVLLTLARVDRSTATNPLGVHHGTALTALQIIANNAFETGRITLDRDGQRDVNVPRDGILTESTYYFVVGDSPSQYPVVPSFRDWAFPHDHVPLAWTSAAASPDLPIARCAITNYSICVEGAHLVPAEHAEWYTINKMSNYGGDINNPANIIRLSPHMHRYFDNRWTALVPKVSRIDDESEYVLHLMNDSAHELFPTFQNTLIQHLSDTSRPYVFARFAWTVLMSVKPFITRGPERNVIRAHYAPQSGVLEYKSEILNETQLQMFYERDESKSATSRKRKTQTDSMTDDDDDDDDDDDES